MPDSTFEKRKARRIENAKWFIWITLGMGGLMILTLMAAVLRNGWERDLPLMFLVFPVLTAMVAGCGFIR